MDLPALSQLLQQKKISPKELVEQSLNNIKMNNPVYNAFITVLEKEAFAHAEIAGKEINKGSIKSPLHGIPVAIKDVIYTKGIRTTMGSKIFEHFVPSYHATVVQKLIDAGAIIIGKTHTHEFAFGPTGDRSLVGPCRNPYNPDKMTGGSSSGSAAAIAANMISIAIGTDTGGSVRIPASACGVVGMKPTFGLISAYGIHPTAYSLDHPGPMTNTVKDNAIMLNIVSGYDKKDSHSLSKSKEDYTRLLGENIKGKIIGLPSYFFQQIDRSVEEVMGHVIDVYTNLGAVMKEVELAKIDEISDHQVTTIQAEAYAIHNKNMELNRSDYDHELAKRLQASKGVQAYQYVIAQRMKKQLIHAFNEIFEDVDVLLTPTLPILPPSIDQREIRIGEHSEPVRSALLRLTAPINYTGNPGISLPSGITKEGLPIGFQLIGKHEKEALLYQIAYAYEQEIATLNR